MVTNFIFAQQILIIGASSLGFDASLLYFKSLTMSFLSKTCIKATDIDSNLIVNFYSEHLRIEIVII